MPVLDRQAVPERSRRPLAAMPPRSVPETAPTPLQRHFVELSVVALVAGAVAISALELGAPLGHPIVKAAVLVGAPILLLVGIDAIVRIWRAAWAWMPVDRGKGLFRLTWIAALTVGLAAVVAGAVAVLSA